MKTAQITTDAKAIIADSATKEIAMQALVELLSANIESFNWVGFYLPNPDKENELVIGPYVGEYTDHTHIPYGRGVCGQVALSRQTKVVQDVSQEENYLSCSINVHSEIVAPILKDGKFVGQIDIDSHTKNAITPELHDLCETICEEMAARFW
jgi:GAF domain-containing protein